MAFLALASLAFAVPVKLDIPAQAVSSALLAFSKQTGIDVLYTGKELKTMQSQGVTGTFEPDDALMKLLDGTGYRAVAQGPKKYLVQKTADRPATGSIHGTLTGDGGKGLPNVLVSIRGTAQSAETDRYGQYVFPRVAAGTYVLVASATGYQIMHITDVQVRAGRDLMLGRESMRKAIEGLLALEPFVVHADSVEELEKIEVTGTKEKPFTANMDIPRTINDAQPYYIFEAKTIDQSGVVNLEDFLKQRLTMNTSVQSNAQLSTAGKSGGLNTGSTSAINLRGLGTTQTLILVNGRRMAGVKIGATTDTAQPDINGIPLAAIERVEVLPSSASAIYGASAVGGVVNIVLKKDYQGGEIRYSYRTPADTDAPIQSVEGTFGMSLEGGRTKVMVTAAVSDSQPLLNQDRLGLGARGMSIILKNNPSAFYGTAQVFTGALVNIVGFTGVPLVLKNGTPLNTTFTHVPAGTSPTTPMATLIAGLVANAGTYDLNFPLTTGNRGLLGRIGSNVDTRSLSASVHRDMTPWLNVFVEVMRNENTARGEGSLLSDTTPNVGPSSPFNPFNNTLRVNIPTAMSFPSKSTSRTTEATVGFIAKLPQDWTAELDYTWSENKLLTHWVNSSDQTGIQAAFDSGKINPFVDSLLYPVDFSPYVQYQDNTSSYSLGDVALRASGPIWHFSWGAPTLSAGLEHRRESFPTLVRDVIYPITTSSNTRTLYFGKAQATDSFYTEATLPIVTEKNARLLLAGLSLQVANRIEQYTVDTGTSNASYIGSPFVFTGYSPSNNGQYYTAKTKYSNNTSTIGIKYQPTKDVILRATYAQAFLPPNYSQLLPNPVINSPSSTIINDPKTGRSYSGYQTISGGNPNLQPQHDKNWNVGLIYAPSTNFLKGLRLDLEFYQITQFGVITTITAQQAISDPTFASRITRDPTTNQATLIDLSSINATKYQTSGYDLSLDYQRSTALGDFGFHAVGTVIEHEKRQTSLAVPLLEYLGFPSRGGEGKVKWNAGLTWSRNNFTAGWETTWYDGYYQAGAANDPTFFGRVFDPFTIAQVKSQGSTQIPSQIYHDVFVGYKWAGRRGASGRIAALLANTSIQVGVKNVFNTLPPFDANYSPYYYSPYGDIRLRDVWVRITKSF